MTALPAGPNALAAAREPIRVMLVDDSAFVRGLMVRWLEQAPDCRVVASLRHGREAVEQLEVVAPDVVVLDVEMPELDGLGALPLLLAKDRDLVVIMASRLTRRQAEISMRALSLGAADYVPKPQSSSGQAGADAFRRELVEKIRHLGARRVWRRLARTGAPPAAARASPALPEPAVVEPPPAALRPLTLKAAPRALVIGASTGGPQALTRLIAQLGPVADRIPILVVQHMPAAFTSILAEHLSRAGGCPVREPVDGQPVETGVIHLAPGGRHMTVRRQAGRVAIQLDDGAPVHFCKPAVDPLFRTAAAAWPGAVVGVILTGMGHDGTSGARAIAASGGAVIAQDAATSVIWGMPGSAAQAGVCAAVLPIDQIAPKLVRIVAGERP